MRVNKVKPAGRRPARRQLVVKLWLPARRRLNWAIIAVLALTIIAPVTDAALTRARYDIKPDSNLLSSANAKLQAKISFDSKAQQYQFNQEGKKATTPTGQTTVGATGPDASKLYSADLPVAADKGVTIYDNVNSLSVGFTPQFATSDGKQRDDKIVYPLSSGQLIYTTKANGLKEDIVLQRPAADKQEFKYKLTLPAELEAKLLPNGGVGVYSADPTLFGNISFGSEADQQKVQAARRNGAKTNLVFAIPAPVIHQTGKAGGGPTAKFALDGDVLTVTANGLKAASYPLSIDPSFVVTSASDFSKGNNESNIDLDSSGAQIKRGGLTGGTVGSWDGFSTASLNTARSGFVTATYNGYIYAATGQGASSSALTSVEYASLSNGTIGTWNTTTAVPASRYEASGVIYNGYFYIGGGTITSVNSATVIYAAVNADGTLGSWNTASSMTTTRAGFKMMAYNDRLYAAAGCVAAACTSGSTATQSVEYVAVKADGTLGTWATTNPFTISARTNIGAAVYNGYIYVAGGLEGLNTEKADGQFAPIKADGTVGTWQAIGNLTVARQFPTITAANGYLYAIGGSVGINSQSSVDYASINADGSLGSWQTSTGMSLGRHLGGGVAVGGYIYMVSGFVNGVLSATTTSTQINSAGVLSNSAWKISGNMANVARLGLGAAVYNGYIYAVGGCDGVQCTTVENKVDYAQILADGTIGTWANTAALAQARAYVSVAAVNGFLYAVGGCSVIVANNCTSILASTDSAAIQSNGSINNWSTDLTHNLNVARGGYAITTYNNYIYVAGGNAGENSVEYMQPNLDGTMTSWTKDTDTIGTGKAWGSMAAWGGYLYFAGGNNGSTYYADVLSSPIGVSGNPGAWTTLSSTPLITARAGLALQAWDGYLYSYSGRTSNGTESTDVEYSRINTDGTLNSWTVTTPAATVARYYFGSAAANGVLYAVGGFNNTTSYQQNATYQYINNGGPGTLISGWGSSANSLNLGRQSHVTVVSNGYLYVAGGCTNLACSTHTATVEWAQIDPALGTVGAWTTSTASVLPAARDQGTGLVANGYIYLMGGVVSGSLDNTTIYAKLPTAGGDLQAPSGCTPTGVWCTAATNFTTARSFPAAATWNGYIYLTGGCTVGGCSQSTYPPEVYYAQSSTSNGSLSSGCGSSWCTTTVLTTGRNAPMMTAYNGYLYVMGGCTTAVLLAGCANPTAETNDVQFAPINSNGTIGSWTATSTFGLARNSSSVATMNGYMYLAGGNDASGGPNGNVQYAAINSNGTLGSWGQTTALSNIRQQYGGLIPYNGSLYMAGGNNNTTALTSVHYVGQQAISRVGRYSKLLDSDVDTNPTKLVANGTAGNALTSNLSVNYLTALSSGASLGNSQTFLSVALGTPTATLTTVSGGLGRYYWLNFTLDDTQAAVYPEAASAIQTTITDFTLYYHANPAKRLRGGKTFTGQTQQSLDASP